MAVELLRTGAIPADKPVLLLAPAQRRIAHHARFRLQQLDLFTLNALPLAQQRIVRVVHAVQDHTVPIADSRALCTAPCASKLEEIADDNHRLDKTCTEKNFVKWVHALIATASTRHGGGAGGGVGEGDAHDDEAGHHHHLSESEDHHHDDGEEHKAAAPSSSSRT